MPAQKRSSDDLDEESVHVDQFRVKEEEVEEVEDGEEVDDGEDDDEEAPDHDEEEAKEEEEDEEQDDRGEEDEDSDGSRSREDDGNKDEYVIVNLADIRKEVQCPICLGIIKKTRTVMECLHRFCRECIDKSMRMGNNECPACRTHCASRRSLRDDPNFDALIAALYHDIDKYEAEELAFRDEEKTRNKQIQASIAQTFQRQTEALGKKRSAKAIATFVRRPRGRKRGRGCRNSRLIELQGSDDEEDGNAIEEDRDSSSAEERSAAVQTKRRKRWTGPRSSQPSSIDADGAFDGNDDLEVGRESTSASPGLISTPEVVLAWGKGGIRSNSRYGSLSGNGKNSRYNRIAKLADHLRSSENNVNKLDVQLIVIPLDKQTTPSMEEPFLYCKPTTSVGSLCQFVAHQTPLQAENIEILVVREPHFIPSVSSDDFAPMLDLSNKDKLQAVKEQETLGELLVSCNFNGSYLVLAYREKQVKEAL